MCAWGVCMYLMYLQDFTIWIHLLFLFTHKQSILLDITEMRMIRKYGMMGENEGKGTIMDHKKPPRHKDEHEHPSLRLSDSLFDVSGYWETSFLCTLKPKLPL